jgi:hypothetical protein
VFLHSAKEVHLMFAADCVAVCFLHVGRPGLRLGFACSLSYVLDWTISFQAMRRSAIVKFPTIAGVQTFSVVLF